MFPFFKVKTEFKVNITEVKNQALKMDSSERIDVPLGDSIEGTDINIISLAGR